METFVWLKQKHCIGSSSDRPAGEWQYKFRAPCGIEVISAVVADSGNWTIAQANEQYTVHTVQLDGRQSIIQCFSMNV